MAEWEPDQNEDEVVDEATLRRVHLQVAEAIALARNRYGSDWPKMEQDVIDMMKAMKYDETSNFSTFDLFEQACVMVHTGLNRQPS